MYLPSHVMVRFPLCRVPYVVGIFEGSRSLVPRLLGRLRSNERLFVPRPEKYTRGVRWRLSTRPKLSVSRANPLLHPPNQIGWRVTQSDPSWTMSAVCPTSRPGESRLHTGLDKQTHPENRECSCAWKNVSNHVKIIAYAIGRRRGKQVARPSRHPLLRLSFHRRMRTSSANSDFWPGHAYWMEHAWRQVSFFCRSLVFLFFRKIYSLHPMKFAHLNLD
jgi:hypothetical protein